MMKGLQPFWRYYGGKWLASPRYPAPAYDRIVEPFAGAGGYSLRYPSLSVTLIDRSPQIAGIWRYLIAATEREILRLPDVPEGGTVDDLDVPQEARWLIGFWCNAAATMPRKSPSRWAQRGAEGGIRAAWGGWNHRSRQRVAAQVHAIRHWRIIEGDYHESPDENATWFIDPPYSTPAGSYYPYQIDDYDDLGSWCRSRKGQVIVCEQEGATWLPFRPFASTRSRHGRSKEVVWTSGHDQIDIFDAKGWG